VSRDQSPAGRERVVQGDLPTLVAIAVIVYAVADVLHEGAGHGGACLLTGGHALVESTVHFDCSADNRLVDAAGTIANLIAGAVAWRMSRVRWHSIHVAYCVWLTMTVNLLQGGGYLLYSGVANIGDWADFIKGLGPQAVLRVGLIGVGACLYAFFVWIALTALAPFVGGDLASRWRIARRLTLGPYLAGGILSCVAGLFNPVGMILIGISAAAASLGGTSGLAWMWQFFRNPRFRTDGPQLGPLRRSAGWIIAGAVTAAAFIGLLGPGVRFR